MAKKKAGGKASQHVSPKGKRLGVKVGDGEKVSPGAILIRQRGAQINAGSNVKVGRDYTLYAVAEGAVKFGKKLGKKIVSVVSNHG